MPQPREAHGRQGRPPLTEIARGQRNEEILRVASGLFEKRGYAAVSITDIAREVGISKAAVLHHAGSKAELYATVLGTALRIVRGSIEDIGTTPEPLRDKLHTIARISIVWLDTDVDLDVMLHDALDHLPPDASAALAQAHADLMAALESIMREGIERGELHQRDPRLLAHAFWLWTTGFGGRRGRHAGFRGQPATAEAVVDLFLAGAAAPPASGQS